MTNTEQSQPLSYKTGPSRSALTLLVLSAVCFLALIPLAYFSYVEEIYQHGMARWFNSISPYLMVGSVFIFTALLALARMLFRSPTEITMIQDALKVTSKARKTYIQYKDIQYLFRRNDIFLYFLLPVRKNEIVIQTRTGVVKFDDSLSRFDEFVNELEDKVYPAFYLACQEILSSGNPISFGVIQLNQQGIKHNDHFILWNQVAKAAVSRGKVLISYWVAGKIAEIKIPAKSIPNLPVLLKLTDDYIHNASSY